jgi:AcrR family transcriptional regulator
MATPLQKARKNPDSVKARILRAARKLFGEYGFHGTTTRMIAKDTKIDISTLHYHWGDKGNLYEAVVTDIYDEMGQKLAEIEKKVKGLPLPERIDIAIEELIDHLFEYPEISNLTLFRYFTKTRDDTDLDIHIPEYISDIAFSMGLSKDKENVPTEAQMKVISMMNSFHNFISGESFFTTMLEIDHDEYVRRTKETLKFFNIPPFTLNED